MAEWVRTTDGTAYKATDWLLDEAMTRIRALEMERDELKAELMIAVEAALSGR